jgi:dTDP-glucose 4,6-dehydratase
LAHEIGEVHAILHLGAESHVTNSIFNPEPFVRSNVLGTMNILDFARRLAPNAVFLYFSTDEVFGPARDEDSFGPWARYNSCNPYAATKAAGEELTLAYGNTYGIHVVVTHTMNCFGRRQHPEKFLPRCIGAILAGREVVIHTDASGRPPSRTWLHAANAADAVAFLVDHATPRSKWNITSPDELSVLDVAEGAAEILGKPLWIVKQPATDRPGNDARYAADGSRLFAAGWKAPVPFEEGFRETVLWYAEHPEWMGVSHAN